MTRIFALIIIVIAAVTVGSPLVAQTDTVFTYQGELNENGQVTNGSFDLECSLFDALSGGSQIGSTIVMNGVTVTDGLLTADLDFGASAFDNTSRWLEIAVNGNTLSPRQPISRSPYSIQTRGIFVDANNNVGIGTTTPISPLHVESDERNSLSVVNTPTSGLHTAGYFEINTSNAISASVMGLAAGGTGPQRGVEGRSQSTSGIGVRGVASAGSGTTYGVYGQTQSPDGFGVYGRTTAITGASVGVYGTSLGPDGFGVYGAGQTGLYGISGSTSGRGVYGYASHNSGTTDGVFGRSDSTSGRGVDAWASASSGTTYGVFGTSSSPIGVGVLGAAVANSGVNYGVVGRSNSSSGFDFLADGAGTDYSSSSSRRWKHNVEPIRDPLRKLAQLRGVYYDWDEEHGGAHDVGMIAEEVGKVLPEIVNYEENGVDAIGMDYSKMTPLLVEAVNALRSEKDREITTLREAHAAETNDLRQQLSELQQIVERLASNQEKENAR